jgi:antitoxin (DNA-binding transcriptional repressor) of toxin-antitoxin stability system
MLTVTLEKAQADLPALIERLTEGEAILITQDTRPVAQLVPPPATHPQPTFGSCKGGLQIVREDNEHLADFAEYVE